ncbi:MFS general substrate transporter [Lojkania enalia]|uniref:MFS general substrate transporter n=1 Tax=Lojkania enalia TaxID=147567 RepID=A0A9P4NB32_9PLEO|nr:MFS general substrate transporter [Didymosphaeria enalia]
MDTEPTMTAPSTSPTVELKPLGAVATTVADPTKSGRPHNAPDYPTGIKLYTILGCLYATTFLVALDRLIVSTAVPTITDQFHSVNDIGWYASAYLLPSCAFMLVFGRLYRLYPVKAVYLTCVTIFEIGSAICGAAPSSAVLIVGRAVAGFGTAGLFSGTVVIMVHTVPLQKRALLQSLFGAVFGVASVLGPVLGGAFTEKVSWRWCFYINLPIGAVVIQFLQLDPISTAVFLPGTALFLLALQWGGVEYPWSSARVIVCLVLSGILLLVFIGVQIWKCEEATLPPRVISQRSVAAAAYYIFFSGASMQVFVYYIPIWFQSIKGVSAVNSGLNTLALVLSLTVASVVAGIITNRTGYFTPSMIVGSVILSIGAGLITTWTVDTRGGKSIGYQVLYGFGIGLGLQQPNMAVQTTLSRQDIPIGTALMFFSQMLGGAFMISVAQNVFAAWLQDYLGSTQGIDVEAVIKAGATGIRKVVEPSLLMQILESFNKALTKAFYVGLAVSCAGIVGALLTEWRSVKDGEGQGHNINVKMQEKEEGKA